MAVSAAAKMDRWFAVTGHLARHAAANMKIRIILLSILAVTLLLICGFCVGDSPKCTLWSNWSPMAGKKIHERVADFYSTYSAQKDCELVKDPWNDGHMPTCECH